MPEDISVETWRTEKLTGKGGEDKTPQQQSLFKERNYPRTVGNVKERGKKQKGPGCFGVGAGCVLWSVD